MITKKTVWNTKIKNYKKEHEQSHKDNSRQYIIDRLKKGDIENMLEMGVGSGILLDNLKENKIKIKYTGIDASEQFIKVTKKKYPKTNIITHDFDETLPFEDDSFDIIYARHVFEHIKHYKYILPEMARVCKKEIIVIFFRPLDKEIIDFRKHKGTYYNSYNKEEFLNTCNTLFKKVEYICDKGNIIGPAQKGKNWILHCEK